MNFTDLFIRRPVLASVVSLMILVLGLRAVFSLPVLQYPRTENAVITVTTTYYGADPDIVAGFITTPLENAIAQANGIDFMTSTSTSGLSTITVNLRLNYDPDKALTEIQTKISSVLNQLPPQSQQPILKVQVGQTIDAMYIGFGSDVLPSNNITDYLLRVVQPKLQSIEGVQTAEFIGNKNFALRAWLNPEKLAAYNITAADVSKALAENDYISGLGNTKGQMVQVNLNASTNLHSLEDFKHMVVRQINGSLVRLEDVATVTLGSEDYESEVQFDGKKAVYIGIQVAPNANLLEVIGRVRTMFPEIVAQLPKGLNGEIVYDSTKFVNSAIHEVESTLIEALLIVTLVVFAFLGSPRSVLIPVVAIPLSLIGAFVFMLAFGFSINLLTLLALVLGIGLVVDDAIIVVENVNRHLEEGMKPISAAIQAARELVGPIIAMTIVLVAVYVPIGFQGGLTGALFTEFAFTLVAAITVSAIVALTLSPMLSSRFLKPHTLDGGSWDQRLVLTIDRYFERIRQIYHKVLDRSLNYRPITYTFAIIAFVCIYGLWTTAKNELAPEEDQGALISINFNAPNATLEQRQIYSHEAYKILASFPESDHIFQLDMPGRAIQGAVFKPWDERKRNAQMLKGILQQKLNSIPGVRSAVFPPPLLPGSTGLPVQFVIQTTKSFDELQEVAGSVLQEAMKSGKFFFLDLDLKIDLPQATVEIDRDKAAQLGLTMSDVGNALASMLGGGYVNYFSLYGRSYKVIPQVEQSSRLNTEQLRNYYIKAADGTTVPLSTIATIKTKTVPESLNHFQQMNSATIQGVALAPLGDALDTLKGISAKVMPQGYSLDYGGEMRQFVHESSGFVLTFAFSVIIIYLTLAAQFESFRDPFIILTSVPMSIAGAMIFVSTGVGDASVNIYTKVGLVTLMGLISKHGILIVEFANRLQEQGKSKREAIEEAAGIRLRPILMTTAAMVLGVTPLIFSSGAGAASRFNMGLVIASGLTIGTFFTLFIVPAFYMLLGADHHKHVDQDEELQPVHGTIPQTTI
ncbi:MAG TPA: efflux RND transporter permease subunit [Rickettsiales bacterium]|nr:efflux RND transporter permease subunit [Rickettsiales bacterium]